MDHASFAAFVSGDEARRAALLATPALSAQAVQSFSADALLRRTDLLEPQPHVIVTIGR